MSHDLATVLLQLRLQAFASSEVLATATGVSRSGIEELLVRAESDRLVQHRDGRVVGWTLTAAGRARGQDLLAAELDAVGGRSALLEAYTEFLPLNAELLSICTDWQTVVVNGEHVTNDHTDARRDAAVLARLEPLHAAALSVTTRLTGALDRFSRYGPRLEEAHRHVTAGRPEWLTRATGGSYHGVWFELHEHLLATLGRTREAELAARFTPTTVGGLSEVPAAAGHPENGEIP